MRIWFAQDNNINDNLNCIQFNKINNTNKTTDDRNSGNSR